MRNIVTIIAPGPSLSNEDLNFVSTQDTDVIVVNNVYEVYPNYDYHVCCDKEFLQRHKENIVPSKVYTSSSSIGKKLKCNYVSINKDEHFNSGALAIQVAITLGYKRIILLGFDCSLKNGLHYFGSHQEHDGLRDPKPHHTRNWKTTFLKYQKYNIYNASAYSELTCFKRIPLIQAYEG